MITASAVTEAVIAALSAFTPERRVAGVGGVGALALSGKRDDGSTFQVYELLGSAYGARSGLDGLSGTSVLLSNSKTVPIEIIESEFPLRFRRFELKCDSGGAGTQRGGLGYIREYEVLSPQMQLTLRGGKHRIPANGLAGGLVGGLGSCVVHSSSGVVRSLPSRVTGVALQRHDIVRIEKRPARRRSRQPRSAAIRRRRARRLRRVRQPPIRHRRLRRRGAALGRGRDGMSQLLTPVRIGRYVLPNRLVMAPMMRRRNDDAGIPHDIVTAYYAQRASAGLIITEGVYPSAMGARLFANGRNRRRFPYCSVEAHHRRRARRRRAHFHAVDARWPPRASGFFAE